MITAEMKNCRVKNKAEEISFKKRSIKEKNRKSGQRPNKYTRSSPEYAMSNY